MKKRYLILIGLVALAVVSQIAAAERFTTLTGLGGAALLDNESGLVWEKSPSKDTFTWRDAQSHCNGLNVGNRKGWRLPTMQELDSLVERNPAKRDSAHGLVLPAGHPFSNVQSAVYWSATTASGDASLAWAMDFSNADVGVKSSRHFVWCVRDRQGTDSQ